MVEKKKNKYDNNPYLKKNHNKFNNNLYFKKKKNKFFKKKNKFQQYSRNNKFENKLYIKIKNYNKSKLKKEKLKITNYLYRSSKIRKGIFLKKPSYNEILYPFHLNLKLINEYLKKK